MEIGLYYYNARYYAPTLARFVSADTLVPDPQNPQSFNRYSYVENRPLNFNDPTGHCANEFFDTDCWDEYDALVNQFKANDYTEEQIFDLIGTGEDYVYKGMRIIDIFDRYRNCGSDFDCSNNSPSMCYDGNGSYPCSQHNRYRPCQYWQPCWEQEILTEHTEYSYPNPVALLSLFSGTPLFTSGEVDEGPGPVIEEPGTVFCAIICVVSDEKTFPDGSIVEQNGFGLGVGVRGIGGYVVIRGYKHSDGAHGAGMIFHFGIDNILELSYSSAVNLSPQ